MFEISPLASHKTPKEIAAAWKCSEQTVRRLFIDEPGVLRLGTKRRGCREYVTLRIPDDVVDRVYRQRIKR